MPGLGVNIDHVATIRQARKAEEPDPVWAAVEAELGGADCITFHLRKDRRHIQDRDVRLLRQTVRCKINMEMSLDEEIVGIALDTRPDQATLVPENRQEVTTEGGLDCVSQADRLREVTGRLLDAGITVSAFVDPEPAQVSAAHAAGCNAIEIHTGRYANAVSSAEQQETLQELHDGLGAGLQAGLIVHAGHGLNYVNVGAIAAMPGFTEFNIGHAIICRAVFTGLREATAEMRRQIDKATAAGR